MHLRLLRHEKWRWYWQDVAVPALVCVLMAIVGHSLFDSEMSNLMIALYLVVLSIIMFMAAVVSAPFTRSLVFKQISRTA